MTREQVKPLRRLVKAEEDLEGYIDRLSIAQADGANAARLEAKTKHHHEWTDHDFSVVLPIDVAIEMARAALGMVRQQLQLGGITQ